LENKTKIRILILTALFAINSPEDIFADTLDEELTVNHIMARADSVSDFQDSLLARTKYRVREEFIFNEIRDNGEIKNSDTVISVVTMLGDEEISRVVESSSRKSEEKKKEKDQEVSFRFSLSDTSYNFSLTETSGASYIIAVSPKGSPKKGDVLGTIEVDRQTFITKRIDLEVPKPEGALKEFATQLGFEPLEGGLVVMTKMNMQGFAKAFLGIFKIRFTGQIRYSDYEILQ